MGILDELFVRDFFVTAAQQQTSMESLSNKSITRGIDFYTKKDYQNAVKEFQRAINLNPSSAYSVDATKYLAQSYLKLDKTDLAIKAYQNTLKRSYDNADLQLALGNLLYSEDRFVEAVQAYRTAVNLDPASSTAHFSLGQGLLQLEKFNEAARSFSNVIRLEPNSPHGYLGLGKVNAKEGNFAEAIDQFDKAMSKQKGYYEAVAEKGYAYADMGEFKKAMEQLEYLDGNDRTLYSLLKAHISKTEPPKMVMAWTTGTFRSSRSFKTPLSSLDSYFSTANASKTMTLKILFSKEMDRTAIENIANWNISRATNANLAKTYNFGQPIPITEVSINPLPNFVLYDAKTLTATIGFTLTQNNTATGTIDPSHIVFKFNGKDAAGIQIDPNADEFSGFSKVA